MIPSTLSKELVKAAKAYSQQLEAYQVISAKVVLAKREYELARLELIVSDGIPGGSSSCSTKSGAISSSARLMFPRLKTSSTSSRTIALFCSDDMDCFFVGLSTIHTEPAASKYIACGG